MILQIVLKQITLCGPAILVCLISTKQKQVADDKGRQAKGQVERIIKLL